MKYNEITKRWYDKINDKTLESTVETSYDRLPMFMRSIKSPYYLGGQHSCQVSRSLEGHVLQISK